MCGGDTHTPNSVGASTDTSVSGWGGRVGVVRESGVEDDGLRGVGSKVLSWRVLC